MSVRYTRESVISSRVARDDSLQRKRIVLLQREKITRAALPGQVIAVLVAVIPFGSDAILNTGVEKQSFPASGSTGAYDPVQRTGSQSKRARPGTILRGFGSG